MPQLLVGGVDKWGMLRELPGAIRYSDELGTRSTLHAEFIDLTNTLEIPPGTPIVFIDDDSNEVFAGSVDTSRDEILTDLDNPVAALAVVIDCVSNDQLLDRRLYVAEHTDQLAGDIVRDIVALFAADGVDDLYVQDGPVIAGRHIFNYMRASDAVDRVAKMAGLSYWIDADLHMHFQTRSSTPSPIELTNDNYFIRSLSRTRTRQQYRNVQYIRAGKGLTDTRVETFVGDGERQTFTLAFPVGTVPTIKVNGFTKTVGINGVETGKDWYWNKESPDISQDDGDTAISDTDTLEVTYKGLFPVLVQARSDTSIAERVSVEGGSGIYEATEDQASIDDQQAATTLAVARLTQYGFIQETLEMSARTTVLRAGMLLPVSLTREGLSGEYLIISVRGNCDARSSFVFTIRAVNGDGVTSWTDYFRQQQLDARNDVASDNEYLLLVRSLPEAVICDDELTVTPENTGSARIDEAIIGFSEIG